MTQNKHLRNQPGTKKSKDTLDLFERILMVVPVGIMLIVLGMFTLSVLHWNGYVQWLPELMQFRK